MRSKIWTVVLAILFGCLINWNYGCKNNEKSLGNLEQLEQTNNELNIRSFISGYYTGQLEALKQINCFSSSTQYNAEVARRYRIIEFIKILRLDTSYYKYVE